MADGGVAKSGFLRLTKLEEHRLLIQAEEHRGRDGNSLWMVPPGSLSLVADNLSEMGLLCLSLSSLKLLSRGVLNYALWEYLACKALLLKQDRKGKLCKFWPGLQMMYLESVCRRRRKAEKEAARGSSFSGVVQGVKCLLLAMTTVALRPLCGNFSGFSVVFVC